MNTEEIINKYKNQQEEVFFILIDDGIVVGEEVDAENRLWYVVRRGEEYSIESALTSVIKETVKSPVFVNKTVRRANQT